jgi:hypothetical protein
MIEALVQLVLASTSTGTSTGANLLLQVLVLELVLVLVLYRFRNYKQATAEKGPEVASVITSTSSTGTTYRYYYD